MEMGYCIDKRHSHLNVFIVTRRITIVQITNMTKEFNGNGAWLDIVA